MGKCRAIYNVCKRDEKNKYIMNRFKLISVLIVLTVVGILLGQNRQLLSLKFLCPDVTNQSCLYRTPALPLAAWIGIFAIAGIFSSLVWQLLNQVATPTKNRSPNTKSDSYRSVDTQVRTPQPEYTRSKTQDYVKTSIPKTDWEQPVSEDWETDEVGKNTQDEFQKSSIKDREQKEPQDRNRSDSAYSYKFREVERQKSDKKFEETKKSTPDDVYDATYRTVSSPGQTDSTSYDEDDEEWI